MKYLEDEFDEMLLQHNKAGGRPTNTGALVWKDEKGLSTYDVNQVAEEVQMRFMLGYCTCGRKVVIGFKRAEVLMKALKRQGVKARIPLLPLRMRLARRLAGV